MKRMVLDLDAEQADAITLSGIFQFISGRQGNFAIQSDAQILNR